MLLLEEYIITRRDVKHARLRVSEDGHVRVIIPLNFEEEDITALLMKKQRWIQKNKKFFESKSKIELQRNQILLYGNRYNYFYNTFYKNKVEINDEYKTIQANRDLLNIEIQEKWLKSVAKKYISKRIIELANNYNIHFNKFYIRSQRKKWGNCSAGKNISINWRIIKAPMFVIDYIIVHELVHTIIMKHTNKYWTLLRSYYPEYKNAVDWLDKYGNSL